MFGLVECESGRLLWSCHVAPRSGVLSRMGSTRLPNGPLRPVSQQVLADTQSIEVAIQLAFAQLAGVGSVQVWPPSVVNATCGSPKTSWPATPQTEADQQDSERPRKNAAGSVLYPVQVWPPSEVARTPSAMALGLPLRTSAELLAMTMQNCVCQTHESAATAV